MTEVAISLPEGEELAERVVEAAARQMLQYVTAGDGESEDGYTVPTDLHRRLSKMIEETIREQARKAAPIVAAEMLEEGVQQTNEWGDPRGGTKSLKTVVAEEVKKSLTTPNGRRGEGVLDQLIRTEVQKQIKADLQDALTEAKKVVTDAVTHEATEALRETLSKRIPF